MKHPRSWLSAVSFAQCAFAAVLPAGAELPDDEMDDEMDDSACDESSARIRRWPAVDTRLLAAKTPQWLRSLTLHHQRYQNKHSDNSLSDSKLPKLATMSGDAQSHDECPLDGAVGETSESENNNNDHSPRWPRRSTAAQRFAKLSRIALPPLGAHQARPALLDASLSPAGSWLLPIIPSAHRRKAYKGNIKEQHKQFSAQTDRLPPIASPSPSGPSLSAPLPSNKGKLSWLRFPHNDIQFVARVFSGSVASLDAVVSRGSAPRGASLGNHNTSPVKRPILYLARRRAS